MAEIADEGMGLQKIDLDDLLDVLRQAPHVAQPPENVFDELKNHWGFSGFCAKSKATTELAARLLLVVYNLWTLFVRFIVPKKHTEAKRGRR